MKPQTQFLEKRPGPPEPEIAAPQPRLIKPMRSRGIYIILGLAFGALGFHNFYAGHYRRGAAELCSSVVSLLLILIGGRLWERLPSIGFLLAGAIAIAIVAEIFGENRDGDGDPLC